MMKLHITILVLLFSFNAIAQKELVSKLSKVVSRNLKDFIPAGYDTLATAKGDLNKDGFEDVVMILKSKLEEKGFDEIDYNAVPPRIFLVLSKSGNNPATDAYFVSAITTKAVLCKNCGGIFGDPFAGLEISKGLIKLSHYGGSAWRWGYIHIFRFKQGKYYLIGSTSFSYWNVKNCPKLNEFAATEYLDVNHITGQYAKKKISENCKLLINKKGKQLVKPLVDLEKFEIEN